MPTLESLLGAIFDSMPCMNGLPAPCGSSSMYATGRAAYLAARPTQGSRGFSLAELMVVALLLAVLSSLAIPLYRGYVQDARRTILLQSMATLHLFQEDVRLNSGYYAAGVYDTTDPSRPITTLTEATGWQPAGAAADVVYSVTVAENSYMVIAKTTDGLVVTRTFP